MNNNDTEIARLAVELATDILCRPEPLLDDVYTKAQRLLALAEPQKPKRFPGFDAEPAILGGHGSYYVQAEKYGWLVWSPDFDTPAEAVAAWNEMIARIAGVDEETVRLMRRCHRALLAQIGPSPVIIKDIDRWLAVRKGANQK